MKYSDANAFPMGNPKKGLLGFTPLKIINSENRLLLHMSYQSISSQVVSSLGVGISEKQR